MRGRECDAPDYTVVRVYSSGRAMLPRFPELPRSAPFDPVPTTNGPPRRSVVTRNARHDCRL